MNDELMHQKFKMKLLIKPPSYALAKLPLEPLKHDFHLLQVSSSRIVQYYIHVKYGLVLGFSH